MLGFFLDCYSKFDWNKCALTISGAVSAVDLSPLDSPAAPNSSAEFLLSFDRITTELCSRHTAVRLAVHSRNAAGRASGLQAGVDGEFHRRGLCNVIDPTSPLNNAARSVDLQGRPHRRGLCIHAYIYIYLSSSIRLTRPNRLPDYCIRVPKRVHVLRSRHKRELSREQRRRCAAQTLSRHLQPHLLSSPQSCHAPRSRG